MTNILCCLETSRVHFAEWETRAESTKHSSEARGGSIWSLSCFTHRVPSPRDCRGICTAQNTRAVASSASRAPSHGTGSELALLSWGSGLPVRMTTSCHALRLRYDLSKSTPGVCAKQELKHKLIFAKAVFEFMHTKAPQEVQRKRT